MKENGFILEKARSRRYPARTMTDVDCADDIVFLTNKTESLLYSLERTAGRIGFHMNANKMESLCFNQRGDIFTLYHGSLKPPDKFTYHESSVSSTENDINTRLAKAWAAIDRLSVMGKSDLSNKIKRNFFQAAAVSILLYGCTI